MTTDAATTPDPAPELTAEQQASADASAFSEGFDSVGKADSQDEPAKAAPKADSEEPAKPESEAAKEGEEEAIAGLGFTASEIKTLLKKIPQVDKLEEQLRKAHGKIGELNSTVQELRQRPAPPAATPAADEGPSAEELETDYPDIARLVRLQAGKIADERFAALKDNGPALTPGLTAEQVERMLEERSMAQHYGEDWREAIVESDDYQLWLASQPDDYRERATTTPHASELSKVLDAYKAAKSTAGDRVRRNKERLERSIVPEGTGGKPAVGPSEIDEFRAGFHSVRGG